MNPRLSDLYAYPFERLRKLFEGTVPPAGLPPINLGIGEPQHPTPAVVTQSLVAALPHLGKYPPTAGTPALRSTIADWHHRRYAITLDADREIIPVAGTREALFAFVQSVLDPQDPGLAAMPNPFYQIYEGGALMAGARPLYIATPPETAFKPDWDTVSPAEWSQVKLLFVCSPGNPAGAVFGLEDWRAAFDLADRYGFVIAADECYSEIYNHDAPTGALQAASLLGRGNSGLVSFNSLSKRSSAPGLRSGFVAGDAAILERFLLYRTYHGCAPSLVVQEASTAAWRDEDHVIENRDKYREKFRIAAEILGERVQIPDAGFFLWLSTGSESDEEFALRVYSTQSLTVLPGSYLAREAGGVNPGSGWIRVALVPEVAVCREALTRLAATLRNRS